MVARQLAQAANTVITEMGRLGLPLNLGKTCVLSSAVELTEALLADPEWPFDASFFASTHRDLGGDATDGRHRRVPTQAGRLAAASAAAGRLQKIGGGRAAARVHRAGPAAKASWGAHIMGLGNSALRSLRVSAARSFGPLQPGSSLGLTLLLSGGPQRDPLSYITTAAVKTFVSVWWNKSVSKAVLASAFQDAVRVSAKVKPWSAASQPVAALVLSLARIGWRLDFEKESLVDHLGRS